MNFRILNWNLAGSKYLEIKEDERKKFRQDINNALKRLLEEYSPHVVTLQEVVRYGASSPDAIDLIEPIENYHYCSFPFIDSENLSIRAKWDKYVQSGNWDPNTFFAQGNAILFRKDTPPFPVWSLPASGKHEVNRQQGHFIERVNLESGLYFGDRNTEPRAALVAHFVFNPLGDDDKPLDIFVVNLHLTTLMMEREGIPKIDAKASNIRLDQLDIIFNGIVSRYNSWKQQGYPERGKSRMPETWETFDRHPPVWILAGDFNFTPESSEYATMQRMNFIDVVPIKGSGTKAKGRGKQATLTVDYVFAGPKFISLHPLITATGEVMNNSVDHGVIVSDHYPMFASIPLAIGSL